MSIGFQFFDYEPQRYRRPRTVSHYITFFLGTRFPRAIPLVFVIGYPKSGTTWVCQIVADYLQLPFPRYSILPVGCPAVVHGHEIASARFPRGVYVMRDGRDAQISKFFYAMRSLNIPAGDDPRLTRQQRAMFPKMTNRDRIRENLPAFLERQMIRPAMVKVNWSTHVESYLSTDRSGLVVMKYEHLRAQPIEAFQQAMTDLGGHEADPKRVSATIDKFSFENQAGRTAGQEDRKSFLRKGTVGDWQSHFTREAAQVFDHYCGETLVRAGYETDDSWVDGCPKE